MLYPYRIRVHDIREEKALDRLMHDRTVTLSKDKEILRNLGHKLKPIRNDIFIGMDRKYFESNISLKNPFLRIEKKNKDYFFRI